MFVVKELLIDDKHFDNEILPKPLKWGKQRSFTSLNNSSSLEIRFRLSPAPYWRRRWIIGTLFNMMAISNGHQSCSFKLRRRKNLFSNHFRFNADDQHQTKKKKILIEWDEFPSLNKSSWPLLLLLLIRRLDVDDRVLSSSITYEFTRCSLPWSSCFVVNKSDSSTAWKISEGEKRLDQRPTPSTLVSLSLVNFWFELCDAPAANFSGFPLEVFFKSTILFREILPVVLRRRDKYEANSVDWFFVGKRWDGGARKAFSFVSAICLQLLDEEEFDQEVFGVVGAVIRRPFVA